MSLAPPAEFDESPAADQAEPLAAADQDAPSQESAAEAGTSESTQTAAAAGAGHPKPANTRPMLAFLAGVTLVLILGFLMILLVRWGARFTRRRIGKPLGPSHPLTDEWYSKPLGEPPPPKRDEGPSQMGS